MYCPPPSLPVGILLFSYVESRRQLRSADNDKSLIDVHQTIDVSLPNKRKEVRLSCWWPGSRESLLVGLWRRRVASPDVRGRDVTIWFRDWIRSGRRIVPQQYQPSPNLATASMAEVQHAVGLTSRNAVRAADPDTLRDVIRILKEGHFEDNYLFRNNDLLQAWDITQLRTSHATQDLYLIVEAMLMIEPDYRT